MCIDGNDPYTIYVITQTLIYHWALTILRIHHTRLMTFFLSHSPPTPSNKN